MTETARNNAGTTRGRPFQLGNPGRPKGARHRTTLAMQALLEGEGEALTRKAVEMALAGDAWPCGCAWTACCPRCASGHECRTSTTGEPQGRGRRQCCAASGRGRRRDRSGRGARAWPIDRATREGPRGARDRDPVGGAGSEDRSDRPLVRRIERWARDAASARAMLRHGARSHHGRSGRSRNSRPSTAIGCPGRCS